MNLPGLPAAQRPSRAETVVFSGLNFSDDLREGQLTDCRNLTAQRYPHLSVRQPRAAVEGYAAPTAITAWNKLVVVDGTTLRYDGEAVGTVSAGEKQFAVVNTKLVIWPDKKYLDMESMTLKDLGPRLYVEVEFHPSRIVVNSAAGDLRALFRVGDVLTISGASAWESNNRDFTVRSVDEHTLTTDAETFNQGMTYPMPVVNAVCLERRIPDMDFICASENRLWGCSSAQRTIYASCLGDPTNFFIYEGLSTDGYALAVGSEGDFTGCCALASSVLFWKEKCLHKILGGFPAEYSMSTHTMDGVQLGSSGSLQVVNDVLYYMGRHGVYAYSGGTPALLTEGFERRGFTDGVAGTDGRRYYLCVREGEAHRLFVYDERRRLWLKEDDLCVSGFARVGSELYMLTREQGILQVDGGGAEAVEWFAELAPFYETAQGKKLYSRLLLRVELAADAWLCAEVKCDDGAWRRAGFLRRGTRGTRTLRLVPTRCDRFQLRLSGCGACALLALVREARLGSDK